MKAFFLAASFLFSVNVLANPLNCSKQEWIISVLDSQPNSQPNSLSLGQVQVEIQQYIPVLKTTRTRLTAILVEYVPVASPHEDEGQLTQFFEHLINKGLNVECNGVVDPAPSLTGRN